MNKVSLRFVDITECELFLTRFFAAEYDGRMFIKPEQRHVVESVERSSKTDSVWRLPNDHIEKCLQKLVAENELFLSIAPSLTLICDGCERASTLQKNTQLSLHFTGQNTEDEIEPHLQTCLDLVLAVLSAVIDSCDVWSISRFFGRICPEVLPPLRRKSQETEGQLNIMSVLISYVMTAEFDDNKGDDPILSENFSVIKEFTDTIVMLADEIQENEKPSGQNSQVYCGKDLMQIIIKKVVKYLTSVRKLCGLSSFVKVAAFLTKHLNEIDENFVACQRLVGEWKQKRAQEAYTNTHVFAFALRDRLVCLNTFSDLGSISPLFKTPLVTSEEPKQDILDTVNKTPLLPKSTNRKMRCNLFHENSESTMSLDTLSEECDDSVQSVITFQNHFSEQGDMSLSSDTILSLKSSSMMILSLEDSGIALDSSYDDNKENIDPRTINFEQCCEKKKSQLGSSKIAGSSVYDTNQLSKLSLKHSKVTVNDAGSKATKLKAKCKRKLKMTGLEAGQTDLKRFFGRS